MAYNHQPCETFFVEDAYTQRTPHEVVMLLSRRKQEAMANELSRQVSETYLEDMIGHMKHMEVNCLDLWPQFLCWPSSRMWLCLTLPQLISSRRFSGSWDLTSSTSSSRLTVLSNSFLRPSSSLSTFSIDTARSESSTRDITNWLDALHF